MFKMRVLKNGTSAKFESWPEMEILHWVNEHYFWPETNPSCPEMELYGFGCFEGEMKDYPVYECWWWDKPDKKWMVAKR